MKITNKKRIAVVLFMVLILFSSINPIFAAINESYNANKGVVDDDLDTKIKDSVVMDALATFAYSIGSMVENLVGKAFQGLTGSNIFPWADRILFNAIPMLDVNIFNPSPSSLFKTKAGEITPLARIVRNTYFTIMTIAVAFLTIVVGIAAVRLAISSIASEKAKYKEAITKWLFSIVLIFLMHNVISFILWMNEQMVVVASSLLNETLLKGNLELFESSMKIDNAKALDNFLEANKSNLNLDDDEINYIKANSEIAYRFLNNNNYRESVLFDAFGDASKSNTNWLLELFTSNGFESMQALKRDIEFVKNGHISYEHGQLSSAAPNGQYSTGGMTYTTKGVSIDDLKESISSEKTDQEVMATRGYEYFRWHHIDKFMDNDAKKGNVSNYKRYVYAITTIYDYFHPQSNGSSTSTDQTPDLMASLGQYFKESAYVVPTDDETGQMTGWHRSKLTISGALLYAIFVFQSIFYFLSYVKRFFYIVILIIMAPVIVIIDFLTKAIV